MSRIKTFVKKEAVLLISLLLAVASAFFVRPSAEYLDYIDFGTLAVLLCLMLVVAGLNSLGLFALLANKLLSKTKTVRSLGLTLVLLCFFSSMVITNDVALITFVPFTLVALRLSGKTEKAIFLVVLETVAANLGSMLTPIGNPQNLYLFSAFEMQIGQFIAAVVPYAVLSLLLLILSTLFLGNAAVCVKEEAERMKIKKNPLVLYLFLFIVALLTVFRVLPYTIALAVTLVFVLVFDKKTVLRADYSLLLTFVFLFVFIGNLGAIEAVSTFLKNAVTGREVQIGIAASQVFSNVPAALLLSGFTQNAKDLLIGVNLGGLGTIIASMASLISFKFIVKEKINPWKYLLVFTAVNVVFLGLNILLWSVC